MTLKCEFQNKVIWIYAFWIHLFENQIWHFQVVAKTRFQIYIFFSKKSSCRYWKYYIRDSYSRGSKFKLKSSRVFPGQTITIDAIKPNYKWPRPLLKCDELLCCVKMVFEPLKTPVLIEFLRIHILPVPHYSDSFTCSFWGHMTDRPRSDRPASGFDWIQSGSLRPVFEIPCYSSFHFYHFQILLEKHIF